MLLQAVLSGSYLETARHMDQSPTDQNPEHELAYRLRQQELLTEFGRLALQPHQDFEVLLQEAARLAASGLQTEFAKVLTPVPGENRLLVRSGVGWSEGVVGHATIGADLESPASARVTARPTIRPRCSRPTEASR